MDNIAHTLVGAALGRAVADRRAPAPALLGAFAANVPDIAELFLGLRPGHRSDYLTLHRGITHSLIGALVEVALLTLAAGTVATWWARHRGQAAPSWRWILALMAVTVLAVQSAWNAGRLRESGIAFATFAAAAPSASACGVCPFESTPVRHAPCA